MTPLGTVGGCSPGKRSAGERRLAMNDVSDPDPIARLSQSPVFWILLFGGTALLILAVMSRRIAERQVQLERRHQARSIIAKRAAQQQQGEAKREEPEDLSGYYSTTDRLIISVRPLMYVVGSVMVVGAVWLAWSRRRTGAAGREASG